MRSSLRGEPFRGLAVIAAAACLAGCVSAATSPGGGRYEDLPWYSGDVCDQVRESDAEAGLGSQVREVEYDARLHVLHAVCERSKVGPRHRHDGEHRRADKITGFDGWKVHTHFEGQALDPIRTALFVVLVVDGPPGQIPDFGSRLKATFGLRRGMGELPSTPPEWEERPPPAYGALGIAHLYAEQVDDAALGKALREARIPPEAVEVFEYRFRQARSLLRTRVLGMTSVQKKVFVEVPRRAFDERRLYHQLHADLYSRLEDEIEGARSKAVPPPPAKLAALRSEYVTGCGSQACTFDPFHVRVTEELAKAWVALGDAVAVRVEDDLLHREGITRQRFANVVADAQWEVASRSREAYDLRERARSKKVDAATAGALLGGVPPVHFTREHFLWNDDAYPRYSELVEGRPRPKAR